MKHHFLFACCFAIVIAGTARAQPSFAPGEVIARPGHVVGPTALETADLDFDGDLDLVVAGGDRVIWFENRGGTDLSVVHDVSEGARAAVTSDVDGDGDTDLILAPFGEEKLSWCPNGGHGSFGPGESIPSAMEGVEGLKVGDLDGDGRDDLVAYSTEHETLEWYRNAGGRFESGRPIEVDIQRGPRAPVRLVDMDGDGDLDVVAASESEISVKVNDGTGSFGIARTIGSAEMLADYQLVDADGDSDLDVLVATSEGWGRGANSVEWWRNDGGFFFSVEIIDSPFSPRLIAIGDYDSEGDLDMLVIATSSDWVGMDLTLYTAPLVQSGDFQKDLLKLGNDEWTMTTSDFDGDGMTDIVLAGKHSSRVELLHNLGDRRFEATILSRATVPAPGALEITNAAGDGSTRVVVAGRGMGVTFSPRDGWTPDPFPLDRAVGPWAVGAADFDADGALDIVAADLCQVEVRFGGGASQSMHPGAMSLQVVDLDLDGDDDILTVVGGCLAYPWVVWFRNDGDRLFVEERLVEESAWAALAADLDGDGYPDIITTRHDSTMVWYVNDGSGGFTERRPIPGDSEQVAIADMDQDGDLDLFAEDAGELVWFENDGAGVFSVSVRTGLTGRAVLGDLDGDGDPDLVLSTRWDLPFNFIGDAYPEVAVSWYENIGGGVLDEGHALGDESRARAGLFPEGPSAVPAIGDVNDDGANDIVVASPGTDAVRWYPNTTAVTAGESKYQLPNGLALHPNYPNPFSASTIIAYDLPRAAEIRIEVFDVYGRRVTTLVEGWREAGRHTVRMQAGRLATGTYVARLAAGEARAARLLQVVR